VSHLREKTKHQGKIVLVLDDHATHVIFRVITDTGPQELSIIRLVPHPSHIAQPIDLYTFGFLKTIYYKERKFKVMKGETRKMYHAVFPFYQVNIGRPLMLDLNGLFIW
jgi:hypothetical protein